MWHFEYGALNFPQIPIFPQGSKYSSGKLVIKYLHWANIGTFDCQQHSDIRHSGSWARHQMTQPIPSSQVSQGCASCRCPFVMSNNSVVCPCYAVSPIIE